MTQEQFFESHINIMAKRASIVFFGGYNDFDDFVQIGRIALWKAKKKNRGIGYIKSTIRHEIFNNAIDSYYIISAGHRTKLDALCIRNMMQDGLSDEQILREIKTTRSKFATLRQMAMKTERILE